MAESKNGELSDPVRCCNLWCAFKTVVTLVLCNKAHKCNPNVVREHCINFKKSPSPLLCEVETCGWLNEVSGRDWHVSSRIQTLQYISFLEHFWNFTEFLKLWMESTFNQVQWSKSVKGYWSICISFECFIRHDTLYIYYAIFMWKLLLLFTVWVHIVNTIQILLQKKVLAAFSTTHSWPVFVCVEYLNTMSW